MYLSRCFTLDAVRSFSDLGQLGSMMSWILCLLFLGFWPGDDEPESLILAQSERWRHA
jgi:hypothetical protein